MADPKGNEAEVLRQINETFEASRAQLQELRVAVERAQRMAEAHEGLVSVKGLREEALLRLGEAVYKLIQLGELDVPPALKRVVAEVKVKEEAVARQQSDIGALLEEAEQVVEKEKAPPKKKKGGK